MYSLITSFLDKYKITINNNQKKIMKKTTALKSIGLALCVLACNTDETTVTPQEVTQDISLEYPTTISLTARPSVVSNWKLQTKLSNEFNYASKSSNLFSTDWQDYFFNGWEGPPPLTKFTPAQSTIENNMLVFRAKIVNGRVQTGCVTSKGTTSYPMYMEARVKISNSDLSSAVWMLSDDSLEELDNLEAWGNVDRDYYSKVLHLSHHIFKPVTGKPKLDYQPTGNDTFYSDGKGTKWTSAFHVYGVLWNSPKEIKYYVDNKLVRTVPVNQIDPKNYTTKGGLTKPMHMIISQAAQPWRETLGNIEPYLVNPSVTNIARTVTQIDWIRTYKP